MEANHDGSNWSVKNLFELKNARRILIEQNLFENNWVHSQVASAILFTVRTKMALPLGRRSRMSPFATT